MALDALNMRSHYRRIYNAKASPEISRTRYRPRAVRLRGQGADHGRKDSFQSGSLIPDSSSIDYPSYRSSSLADKIDHFLSVVHQHERFRTATQCRLQSRMAGPGSFSQRFTVAGAASLRNPIIPSPGRSGFLNSRRPQQRQHHESGFVAFGRGKRSDTISSDMEAEAEETDTSKKQNWIQEKAKKKAILQYKIKAVNALKLKDQRMSSRDSAYGLSSTGQTSPMETPDMVQRRKKRKKNVSSMKNVRIRAKMPDKEEEEEEEEVDRCGTRLLLDVTQAIIGSRNFSPSAIRRIIQSQMYHHPKVKLLSQSQIEALLARLSTELGLNPGIKIAAPSSTRPAARDKVLSVCRMRTTKETSSLHLTHMDLCHLLHDESDLDESIIDEILKQVGY